MDQLALRDANALAGNDAKDAAIELAFMGMDVRAHGGPVRMALAGAAADIDCNGRAEHAYRTFTAQEGERVRIGPLRDGVYAILAISGGFDIMPAMGSRSLDARAGLGGWQGRPLRAGDTLPLRAVAPNEPERFMSPPRRHPRDPIRLVMGPQHEAFTERGLQTLIGRSFTVSPSVSRMAYKLDGPSIERRHGFEMISDGTLPGSIQVPPDGHPIVLMADRQTVGGYPKIATVIGADLGRLAQRRPGETVIFTPVSAAEAREIARQARMSAPHILSATSGFDGTMLVQEHQTRVLPDLERIGHVADAVVDASDAMTWELHERPRALIAVVTCGSRLAR